MMLSETDSAAVARARWYVAQTHPNAEAKAAGHLLRQGFGVYVPRYLKRRRHARRVEDVAAPLFARYLFVSIDTRAPRWRAVQSTVGISQLICSSGLPIPIADNVVDGLRSSEDDNGLIRLPSRSLYKQGDQVKILDGAFASCIGLFQEMRDEERVIVLLDLLGRKVRVTVWDHSVAAA